MRTIHEDEVAFFSCADFLVFLIKRTLNLNSRSSEFYATMNPSVMREILDDLQIGHGVFD